MSKKFDMLDCNGSPTPSVHGVVLCRDDGVDLVDETTYRSIVGSLMFLTHMRPNITYSVSFVSRYMKNPCEIHMVEEKKILRYVKDTPNFDIHYYSSEISILLDLVIQIGEVVWMTISPHLEIVSHLVLL